MQYLRVYPNPAHDRLNVILSMSVDSEVTLNLIDMAGRELKQASFSRQIPASGKMSIDLHGLPVGMYICRVQVGDSIFHQPFIKQ